jgi:hypothetical protein
MMRKLLDLINCTRGTASLEAIIVLPLLISLMAGGVEFGRILSAYGTADKSMRDAARYLARVPKGSVDGWGLDNAKSLAIYGKLDGNADTDPKLITGWAPDTITCSTCADVDAGTTDVIHFHADVPFTVVILSAVGLPNTYTISVTHEERWIGE